LKIKICGLTRPEDVALAVELGADLCGFILAPSPRRIGWEQLEGLRDALPTSTLSVAVMVDPEPEEVDRALALVDRVQLHGSESPEFCRRYRRRVWKAFRIRQAKDLALLDTYSGAVGAFLLDSFTAGLPGGTGKTFSWDYLEGRRFPVTTFLAGGLSSANVAEAGRVGSVQGLDVSSGVESEPGRKCPDKMRRFFAAARGATDSSPAAQSRERQT
jgi:phosphoribosylanthranilate isomerase